MFKHTTPLDRLGLTCLLEATTLLLLVFVAVPLKHLAHLPQYVQVIGPVHGFMFLVFCRELFIASNEVALSKGLKVRLFLAALVPFGGFVSWRLLRSARTEQDNGPV